MSEILLEIKKTVDFSFNLQVLWLDLTLMAKIGVNSVCFVIMACSFASFHLTSRGRDYFINQLGFGALPELLYDEL